MTVIISKGAHVRAQASLPWSGKSPTVYAGPNGGSVGLWGGRSATYEQIVFNQPWVYAAIRTFYLAIGRLPDKVYSGLEGEDRHRLRDHEVARLLRTPHRGGSGFERKGDLAYNLFSQGNHVELKIRPAIGAPPEELWPIPYTWVQEIKDGTEIVGYRVFTGTGAPYPLSPADVVHYRLMGGRSPLEPLRRTLGIEDAGMDWQMQALENGPSLRGAFATDATLSDRTIPRLRAELEELYAGPGGNALGLFDQGLKFSSISQSAGDVGVIETRKATREEVAACFGIPAPMIGILDHATYSNISELRRSFYVDTVAPYLTLIEETEQAQLIQPEPAWKSAGIFVEFDMGEILKPDPLQEAQSLMLLTSSGTNSTNDNRKLKRMDPIGDPSDPENPYNRPRVPANLLDPEAPEQEQPAQATMPAFDVQKFIDDVLTAQEVPVVRAIQDLGLSIAAAAPAEPMQVIVNVPEQPAPTVNVAAAQAPIVNVAAAEAPIVNVALPEPQPPRAVKRHAKFELDQSGRIVGKTETEVYEDG
jgi:HK97 family phage portal protein